MVHAHADDILITGRNKEEYDRLLHDVLEILHKHGLTLNYNKCIFGDAQTAYLGYIISNEGIKINPKSIVN